jgi:putative FmdB family regulatory protein
MPIYEFVCDDCTHKFEALTFSTITEKVCPDCGGKTKRVHFSPSSFRLKGGGWPGKIAGSSNGES